MTDDQLVSVFERGEVPDGGFHHREHVRVARHYLRQHGIGEAIARFIASLRRFAAAQGKPGLYHQTVTVAFLLLVAERLIDAPLDEDWSAFAARHPDLFCWEPSVLDRYYRPETLWSDRARAAFVMPDRIATA